MVSVFEGAQPAGNFKDGRDMRPEWGFALMV